MIFLNGQSSEIFKKILNFLPDCYKWLKYKAKKMLGFLIFKKLIAKFGYRPVVKVEDFKNWGYLLEPIVEIHWFFFFFLNSKADELGPFFHKTPLKISKSYFSARKMQKIHPQKKSGWKVWIIFFPLSQVVS